MKCLSSAGQEQISIVDDEEDPPEFRPWAMLATDPWIGEAVSVSSNANRDVFVGQSRHSTLT